MSSKPLSEPFAVRLYLHLKIVESSQRNSVFEGLRLNKNEHENSLKNIAENGEFKSTKLF